MKLKIRLCLWVLLMTAFVLPLNSQTFDTTRLVGKWKMSKTRWQGEPHPSDGTLVISVATTSHFKWHLSLAHTQGSKSVWNDYWFNGDLEGKRQNYQGGPPGTEQSYVQSGSALEGTLVFANGDIGREVMTLSPDGDTITSQCTFSSANTTKSWTEVWERVPDKKR